MQAKNLHLIHCHHVLISVSITNSCFHCHFHLHNTFKFPCKSFASHYSLNLIFDFCHLTHCFQQPSKEEFILVYISPNWKNKLDFSVQPWNKFKLIYTHMPPLSWALFQSCTFVHPSVSHHGLAHSRSLWVQFTNALWQLALLEQLALLYSGRMSIKYDQCLIFNT